MVKVNIKQIVIFFITFSSLVLAAPLQYLTKTIVSETSLENPTANNWNAGDDASIQINIGFNFPFNGTTYNQVWINSNGMLSFSSSNTAYNNLELPYSNEVQSIYPYWDDLYRRDGGTIRYDTLGDASNRHLVIAWENVRHYSRSGRYSFEVVLYEDGAIRFRYDASDDADGTSYNGTEPGATIGVQEDTSHYDQHSYNAAINQNQDVLYIPNPINVPGTNPSCTTPIQKIGLSTYDTTGYGTYPNNATQYQTLISNYATASDSFGSGYVDQINGSGNPYGTNNDYLSIFNGYLYFPDTGIYKFGIDGDDAVEVYIDDTLVTGWYGGHGSASHATHVVYVNATQGWHKVEFHHQERSGGDNYYLYWQRPTESSIAIIPSSRYYHCVSVPTLIKSSCVIHDGINTNANAKRIPGATIRYAFQVSNIGANNADNVIVEDDLNTKFDHNTIKNLQIQNGSCDCLGVSSSSNNGANGTANGVNPVKLDFGTVAAGSSSTPTVECGYFEVDIK